MNAKPDTTLIDPPPLLIVGIDGRKVTVEMVFRSNRLASQWYDDIVADCRRGVLSLNMEVKPHA